MALIVAGLGACNGTGDFGRPAYSPARDALILSTGVADGPGTEVLSLPLTDDERELRDRAYRFLALRDPAPSAYYAELVGTGFRSPASRFSTIAGDAAADSLLIGPFVETAHRVLAADRARLAGMLHVRDLTSIETTAIGQRVHDNRCLIAQVKAASGERARAYRYALEHGFLAMPQGEAIAAERALHALDIVRGELDGLPAAKWRDGACVASGRTIRPPAKALVVKG